MKNYLMCLIVVFLFIVSCDKDSVSPSYDNNVKKIFSGTVSEMDMDYPYLYVAAYTDGLWRIDISNDDYQLKYLPLLDSTKNITIADYVDAYGNKIIVTTMNGIWRSIDGGNNWVKAENGIEKINQVAGIGRFPQNPIRIITFGNDSTIFYSDNEAESWQLFYPEIRGNAILIKCNTYIEGEAWMVSIPLSGWGYMTCLSCINDYGKELKHIVDIDNLLGAESDDFTIASEIDFDQDNIFILIHNASNSFVYKSSDGGYNWLRIYDSISDSIQISSFVKDPRFQHIFYLTDIENNIYLSKDTFQTFQCIGKFPTKEKEEFIYRLVYEIEKNRLFAMTGYGLYVISLADLEL